MSDTLRPLSNETAASYAERVSQHFARKSDHNKRESLNCFTVAIFATLALSPFVAFGGTIFVGKIIPIALSLLATGLNTWLQFRKPHQLWAIYRTAQRQIEFQIANYRFDSEPYATSTQKDGLLAKRVTEIALAAHELWVPLIPSPEALDRVAENRPSLVHPPGSRNSHA